MNDKQKLGKKLFELRKQAGLIQYELSRKTGIAPTTIKQIESGVNNCLLTTLVKLADFFDVSLDELCGRDSL